MMLSGFFNLARGAARLRLAAVALLLPLLAACGFQMRGTTPLPFDSIYIGIADNTLFGAEVRRSLRAVSPNTRQVASAREAQAWLQDLGMEFDEREISLDPQGHVEEYELSLVFRYRLIDSQGRVIVPDTTLSATRDMPYDPQVVQAKQGERETLYQDMQRSMVDRIIRRLTAPDVQEAAQRAAAARARGEDGDLPLIAPVESPDRTGEPPEWPSQPAGLRAPGQPAF